MLFVIRKVRLVNLLCTCSITVISRLRLGDHTELLYSSSGRTYVTKARTNKSTLYETKHLRTKLALWWALLIISFMYSEGDKFVLTWINHRGRGAGKRCSLPHRGGAWGGPSPPFFSIFYFKRRFGRFWCAKRSSHAYACIAYFHFHQYKPTTYTYKYAPVTHSCSNQRKNNNEVTDKQPVTVEG